jgi:hypothetical protein
MSVAISIFPIPYEITSVNLLPRNDITTQPPKGEGWGKGESEDIAIIYEFDFNSRNGKW